MTTQQELNAKPASFKDIAFGTGVIAERTRTLRILNDLLKTAKVYEYGLIAEIAKRIETDDAD
jgi:hypothetical protein